MVDVIEISEEVEEEPLEGVEELEFKRQDAERAKIGAVEGFIVLGAAAIADLFEILAGLVFWVPIFGQVIWFLAFTFGLFISGTILIWSLLRGISGRLVVKRAVRRLIFLMGGFLADALTVGVLPIRTITLAITIWLNNRSQGKELSGILKLLEKV
ncbi:MAG: hypothetical protein HYS89_01390 [Candidatus Colwellbacteria bacterium]|nr:hypothetical protein [Candidatus Colwellbacteria bacterium]